MMNLSLNGHRTLVIGAARGIGAEIVRQCAHAGSRVAWTHLDSEADRMASAELMQELDDQGAQAWHQAADCCDEEANALLFSRIGRTWGGLEHLVYCAGFTSVMPFEQITTQDWRRVVDINLNGAFLALSMSMPMLKSNKNASVVLIGSAAMATGGGGRADYASAKAGLEGLNRALAKEFGPQGIRCNLLHPSLIDTDLLKQRHPEAAKRRELAAQVPLRRLGKAEDVAAIAVFLLSDLAAYITAQSIFIDGGRTCCG
jgi:3-oxoacyl-[acyl-carrier protein] reductase